MNRIKKITHAIGIGVLAGAGWIAAHPQILQAVVSAYPKLAILGTGAGVVLALYSNPQSSD